MITLELTKGKIALIDDEDAGLVAGYTWYARGFAKRHGLFYAVANVPGTGHFSKKVSLHRLLLGAVTGDIVDHVNGNGLDNRRENLRLVGYGENNQNSTRNSGSSRFKGVFWNTQKRKWAAKATVNGIQLNLGTFSEESVAGAAYDQLVLEWYGPKGMTNAKIEAVKRARTGET